MSSLSICTKSLTRISFAVLTAIATNSALSAPPTQSPDPAIDRLYDRTKQNEPNLIIRSELALQAKSFDQKIAKAAVFRLSRLGGDESLKEVLIHAKNQGHIDEDAFAGEIARNIRFFAPAQQAEYMALLAKSPSYYGIDVISSHLSSPLFLKQYSLETLKSAAILLEMREPKFPSGIGDYGMTDGFRYTSWLQASAAVRERLGKGSAANFVLAKLTDPNVDPRKVLAYLSDPQSDAFVNQVPRAKLAPAIERMNAFREAFPTSTIIQDVYVLATKKGRFAEF